MLEPEPNFTTQIWSEFHNRFQPGDDIAWIVRYLRKKRVAGEIRILLPGNGGITAITFVERRKTVEEKS